MLRLFLVFICQVGKPAVLEQRTYWITLIPSIKGLCYESKGFLFSIPGGDRLQSYDGDTFLLQSNILLHFSTFESKPPILPRSREYLRKAEKMKNNHFLVMWWNKLTFSLNEHNLAPDDVTKAARQFIWELRNFTFVRGNVFVANMSLAKSLYLKKKLASSKMNA